MNIHLYLYLCSINVLIILVVNFGKKQQKILVHSALLRKDNDLKFTTNSVAAQLPLILV